MNDTAIEFTFTPKTEKQIQEENLWPVNEYDFEVIEGKNDLSKKGNPMIVLKLKVFNITGGFRFVDDYLMESIAYKLRHACDACGLLDKYETGRLAGFDFVGKTGQLKLGIQKDKTGQYADKNVISDYIKRGHDKGEQESVAPAKAAGIDDEIPF